MPFREIIGKAFGFGLTALAVIAGGVLSLIGPRAINDYVGFWLGLGLIAFGLGIGGVGTLLVAGIILDARERQREAALHVTERPGPLAPPPPWGMAEVGRPGHGVVEVGEQPRGGGGGARVMSVRVSSIDGPILLVVLLIWTVAFLIWLAPK